MNYVIQTKASPLLKKKKLRFSLRFLLVAPLLVGCGIAWFTWPDRNFHALKASLANKDFDLANSIVSNSTYTFSDGVERPFTFLADTTGVHLTCAGAGSIAPDPEYFIDGLMPETRSFGDALLARRVYRVREYATWTGDRQHFEFVVQRGEISLNFENGE